MVAISDCSMCDGTNELPHPSAGETVKCFSCNGFGKIGGKYSTGYKTQAMANKHGNRRCRTCKGSGEYTFAMTNSCTRCRNGKEISEIHPGDVYPDGFSNCDHLTESVAETLVNEWEFVVSRDGNGLSWAESFLGLRSIWSCTDYGTAWKNSDESLIEHVKDDLRKRGTQYTNVIDKGSNTIVYRIVIRLTVNGYSVISVGSVTNNPVLPPTYTPELMNSRI